MSAATYLPRTDDEKAAIWAAVARVRAGHAESFGIIYTTYHQPVFNFVYSRTRDVNLAQDLVADVFVKAFRKIDSVSDQGKDLMAWLVTIARNLVADHYKSPKRGEVLLPFLFDADLEPMTGADKPALALLESEALKVAIARLSPPQRQVVEMRFLQEMPLAEVAAALGKNVGAVKALQLRATIALRQSPQVQALAVTG